MDGRYTVALDEEVKQNGDYTGPALTDCWNKVERCSVKVVGVQRR